MNLKLWRVVDRFCRRGVFDVAAFEAFAQLVEEDQESAIRKAVKRWSEPELEQLSFLISGTLDTVGDPTSDHSILQCRGLYLTGSEASLVPLGRQEIRAEARQKMAASVNNRLPARIRIIIGSRIVPVTWVHGFSWKQWRSGLARDQAMFSRPSKAQPKQAPESQAWILPVFIEKGDIMANFEPDISPTGVSELGLGLAAALTRYLKKSFDSMPSDIRIHPLLAAAHCCWANAKTIAVYEWAKAVQAREHAACRRTVFQERPHRGAVQARDAETRKIVARLKPDPSFPVDGTGLMLQLFMSKPLDER